MKRLIVMFVLGLWAFVTSADVTVTNLVVAQRPGTKLMNITYDVSSATTNTVTISLTVSDGATAMTATNLTGDVGRPVMTGAGKVMVWNAGADWNGNLADLNFTLTANDEPQFDFMVIDLSGGTDASSYPVSYLFAVPSGGWTDEYKTTKLVMRKISKGTFTMGSPTGEVGRQSDETQHTVTLTKDFYIGVFEVTQRQWELVMGNKPSYFTNAAYYASRPVEQVSYWQIRENPANSDDPAVDWPSNSTVNATSFMGKLRSKTGLSSFDLPTESQWEYACRAGTTTALNSGKNPTTVASDANVAEVGRYYYNHPGGYSSSSSVSTDGGTANVGSYLPNAWGLYDMHGNVWERCLDWYGTYPGEASDPLGAVSGSARRRRGGGWFDNASYCRSARRDCSEPNGRGNYVGFRGVTLGGTYSVSMNQIIDTRDYKLTVSSAHGTPVPSVGTNLYVLGATSVTCSVPPSVVELGINWRNTGWTGTGSIPVSGTTNTTGAILLTNLNSSITWNWGAFYPLTVNSGTGAGSYTNGTQVTITANVHPGRVFTRWTGATQYVASVTSSTTSVTMPAWDISLTATYADVYYPLTVNNGSGAGSYTNGTRVTITANVQPGQAFTRWTGVTEYVASITSSTTIVTMPAWDISLTATYVTDSTKPTLTIVTPITKARILATNGLFTVRGTAADNKIATNVLVQLNSGSWTNAGTTNGWKNWSLPVMLTSGTNIIRAYSVDSAVNNSITATVACTYVITGTLNIQTNGSGTVTRTPVGEPEVGQPYTLTAAAKTGFVFSSWTGDLPGTNKVIAFTMSTNKTVIANFTDIAKPTIAITAPTALQKVFGTNGDFVVRGTATDNFALSNVMVSVNSGSFVPASTTTNIWKNWSLPVTLLSSINGVTNTIAAYSVDTTGNSSSTVTVKCVYTGTGALNITTNGPGKVTVTPTGPLLLNKTYTLTATANAGGVFSNWVGNVVGNPTGKVVKVALNATNKTVSVTANFIDTAKPTVIITYPANNAKVLTNGLVIIRGTAADNGVLSEVKYQLRTGDWTNVVSTNVFKAWTAPYVPVAGLNTSKVYSVDAQGNHSSTSQVVFTYIPGAVLTVETNGQGTVTPSLNGKVLQIGTTNTMTATAKAKYVFTDWTTGVGGSLVTTGKVVKFVMTSNLVLTANFRSTAIPDAVADVLATSQAAIVVDGSSKDWTDVPRSAFSYATTTQEVAVALDGNNIALLLNGCPFGTSDTVLVYFKLRLTYGAGDNRHTVDLWTSGSVLYGMVDGQVITGLEAVLLNGVLELKIPVEQAPSQVTIEEIGCGMDLGDGTMTELFKIISTENP